MKPEYEVDERVNHSYYGPATVKNIVMRGDILVGYEIAPDRLKDETILSQTKIVWEEDLEKLEE